MDTQQIINTLIIDRQNTLSVKKITVNKTAGSMGNPQISVGTLPYYEWDKVKEITYVLTYGRYLNCEITIYPSLRKDADFIQVKGQQAAIAELNKILNSL